LLEEIEIYLLAKNFNCLGITFFYNHIMTKQLSQHMCLALLGCNKIEDYKYSFYSNLRQRKNIEDHFLPIQHNAGTINS